MQRCIDGRGAEVQRFRGAVVQMFRGSEAQVMVMLVLVLVQWPSER